MSLYLKRGERGFICGRSGSGKSVAACFFLHYMPLPLVIFDTKISPTIDAAFPQARMYNSIDEFHKGTGGKKLDGQHRSVIIRPSPDELVSKDNLDEELYRLYLTRQAMTIYVDEAQDFHRIASRAGRGLMGVVSRGREQGMTFLAGTQRPVLVSPSLMSEANSYYIFRLRLEADKQRVKDWIMNGGVPELEKHHYVHVDSEGEAVRYRPVPLTIAAHLRDRLNNDD